MMKAAFYCFSATGNTKRICGLFADELKKSGYETEYFAIRQGATYAPPSEFDLVFVAYPVHGFSAPRIMTDFAKALPASDGQGYYIIKTSGEPLRANDASSSGLRRKMSAQGYRFKGEFHYVMPYNMLFRHSDKMVALMWRSALNTVPRDAAVAALGGECFPDVPTHAKAIRGILSFEHGGMRILGKFFRVDRKKCVSCGLCVKLCPLGNITMDESGRVKFGNKCMGCTACSFHCPQNAINIGAMNRFKVNGAYKFSDDITGFTAEDVCDYCHDAYLRYFEAHGIKLPAGGDKE